MRFRKRRTPSADDSAPAATEEIDREGGGSSLDVLDRPLDRTPLEQRLRRPGMARSTKVLLGLIAAVLLFGAGATVGRATAPRGGSGSEAPTLGTVDGIAYTPGSPVISVRGSDGTVTALRTTAGTVVAVPRPGGPGALTRGQRIAVTSERGADGAATATRVDLVG